MFRGGNTLLTSTNTGWYFVNSSTVSAKINPVAGIPTGVQTGDLLVIAGVSKSTGSFSTPAGWTAQLLNAGDRNLSVWTKIYAGDTNVTVTNAQVSKVVMLAYRRVNTLDTLGTIDASAGTVTSIATNSLNTATNNTLVISVFGTAATTTSLWTAPAGTTARVNSASSSGVAGLLVVDENKATSGATTARTATLSVAIIADSFAVAFKRV